MNWLITLYCFYFFLFFFTNKCYPTHVLPCMSQNTGQINPAGFQSLKWMYYIHVIMIIKWFWLWLWQHREWYIEGISVYSNLEICIWFKSYVLDLKNNNDSIIVWDQLSHILMIKSCPYHDAEINNDAWIASLLLQCPCLQSFPDSKIHGANMGPIWVLSAPDGPHVGARNHAIRVSYQSTCSELWRGYLICRARM